MNAPQFDALARRMTGGISRRGLLGVTAMFGLTVAGLQERMAARKKRKKKLQFNAFGCVDVGQPCRGNDANCCSGVCDGKKPKTGKKDRSRCVAHDVGGCQTSQDYCVDDVATCPSVSGLCLRTTGNASFCGVSADCAVCSKDADCEASHGPGAACVTCTKYCPDTGNTACSAAD